MVHEKVIKERETHLEPNLGEARVARRKSFIKNSKKREEGSSLFIKIEKIAFKLCKMELRGVGVVGGFVTLETFSANHFSNLQQFKD